MQDNKTSVKKLGSIHIVYIDLVSGKPMKLAGHTDSPEFGFPQTFNSRLELDRAMPGHVFEMFEEPAKASPGLEKLSPEMEAQVAAILGSPKPAKPIELAQPSSNSESKSQSKATAIISRLEFAMQYASLKNQKDIQLRVAILKEAFNEIFN